jgi:hypothetical protein
MQPVFPSETNRRSQRPTSECVAALERAIWTGAHNTTSPGPRRCGRGDAASGRRFVAERAELTESVCGLDCAERDQSRRDREPPHSGLDPFRERTGERGRPPRWRSAGRVRCVVSSSPGATRGLVGAGGFRANALRGTDCRATDRDAMQRVGGARMGCRSGDEPVNRLCSRDVRASPGGGPSKHPGPRQEGEPIRCRAAPAARRDCSRSARGVLRSGCVVQPIAPPRHIVCLAYAENDREATVVGTPDEFCATCIVLHSCARTCCLWCRWRRMTVPKERHTGTI